MRAGITIGQLSRLAFTKPIITAFPGNLQQAVSLAGTGQRQGHGREGLPGMQERAKLVGGKLAVWSELDSGTETEFTIPASLAYAKSSGMRRSMFSGKGS